MIRVLKVLSMPFTLCLTYLAWSAEPPANPTPPRFTLELMPMYMDVNGIDEHVGDIVNYIVDASFAPRQGKLFYRWDKHPINFDPKAKFISAVEASYRPKAGEDNYRLEISGWWFGSDENTSGRVTTPKPVVTPTGYIYYQNYVRMWDQDIRPVPNDQEPSGLSPLDFFARNKLSLWTMDFSINRTFVNTNRNRVELGFFVKISRPKHELRMGVGQRHMESRLSPGDICDIRITNTSRAEADYNLLAGPGLGIRGETGFGRFRVNVFANQSVLMGKVGLNGQWTGIDDAVSSGCFPPFTTPLYREGNMPFHKSMSVAIPVTELKAKILFDITKNIALVAGGFFSLWWDMPVAPSFKLPPGEWREGGAGWETREKTWRFTGVTFGLGVRF